MRTGEARLSGAGTRRAATNVKEPGAARLAGDAGGPSRERRPFPRHRERPLEAPPRERRPQHFPAAKPPLTKGWTPGRRGRMSGAGSDFASHGGICRRLAKPGAPPDRAAGVPAGPQSGAAPCPAARGPQSQTLWGTRAAVRQRASSAPLHQGRGCRPAPADRHRQAETRQRGSAARSPTSSRRARSRRFTGARRDYLGGVIGLIDKSTASTASKRVRAFAASTADTRRAPLPRPHAPTAGPASEANPIPRPNPRAHAQCQTMPRRSPAGSHPR